MFCFQVLPGIVVNFIKKNIFHFITQYSNGLTITILEERKQQVRVLNYTRYIYMTIIMTKLSARKEN